MFKIIIKLLMLIVILCGVICIYDARILTKKFFGFGDQNEGTNGLKFLGFFMSIIGGLVIFFLK